VAHEIKKTCWMRLFTVQSFERKFNPDPESYKNERLLGDIDSTNWHYECVASASNFASMPAQQNETLNVVEVVELAQIFSMKSVSLKVSLLKLFLK
jgi:hypothetical protein